MKRDLPLKTRHYRLIEELGSESGQDLPEAGMRRRAIAMTLLHQYNKRPVQPSLIPSADGSLDAMIFTLPDYVFDGEDNPLWKVFSDLFVKLPADTEFHILLHDDEKIIKQLKDWLQDNKLLEKTTFHMVPSDIRMLIWAEDDYEVVKDSMDGTLYLVQPHSHRRAADDYMGYFLSKSLDIGRLKMPLYFEGGNILVGDTFFLMGADYFVDSMLDLSGVVGSESGTMATEHLVRLFNDYLDKERKLFIVGSSLYIPQEEEREIGVEGEAWKESIHVQNDEGTVQPLFHIDMFLTLAGRNKNGKYQVLVGDTRLATELLGEKLTNFSIPDVFDDVADLLRNQGFEVIRNPLPITYVDDEEQKRRKWFYATSNNALVEIKSENEKTVWLPTYGHGNWEYLKKTDEANKKVWEDLGFKVIQLEDFTPFAEKSGALHCIKKYMRRG